MKPFPLILSASILAAGLVLAGPLSPPPGQPAPTYKTLAEIEPRTPISAATTPGDATCLYKITQPGSYYLTGNITGQVGKSDVVVAASNVTIDLAGFMISGGNYGIWTQNLQSSVVALRGSITGCSSDGIYFGGTDGCRVEDVQVSACQNEGIHLDANSAALRCDVRGCGRGIVCGPACRAGDCSASGNQAEGFDFGSAAGIATRCASSHNQIGFSATIATVFDACTAEENSDSGFISGLSARISGCTARSNGDCGFKLSQATLMERCISAQNAHLGVWLGLQCTVRECIVWGNGQQGLKAAELNCAILNNQVRDNGAGLAGIWINSNGCRVQGNECSGGGFGIYVDLPNNTIVQNTCSQATNNNFSVAPGNDLAPIVVHPGSNNFSTASPWSNFSN